MDRKQASLPLEIVLVLVGLLFLTPIIVLVMMTLKQPAIFYKPLVLPDRLYFEYYKEVLGHEFLRGLRNSTIVTAGGLGATIATASMAGYAIARRSEKLFGWLFLLFMTGMIIPTVGSLIPLFKLVTSLQLANTLGMLVILYTAGLIPFAIFLYSAFTKGIPRELEESANIDGCGSFRLYWVVIFPLLLPATGTFILTQIYGIWNDFVTPLIFLNDSGKMTLMPMIVQFMYNKQSTNYGPVFALCVLAIVPLLLLFVFTQRFLLKGLVVGAVKG